MSFAPPEQSSRVFETEGLIVGGTGSVGPGSVVVVVGDGSSIQSKTFLVPPFVFLPLSSSLIIKRSLYVDPFGTDKSVVKSRVSPAAILKV